MTLMICYLLMPSTEIGMVLLFNKFTKMLRFLMKKLSSESHAYQKMHLILGMLPLIN